MKAVRFHPDADTEMVDAARWYELQQEGLGKRFLASVQEALNRIKLNPRMHPIVEDDVRRCITKMFPFGILFRMNPGFISVMAVMHLHRDPDYWKTRRFESGGQGKTDEGQS